jgi:CheY-like chemotaxis protein
MHVRLKYSGYDTCFAIDAVSAVAVAGIQRPDLIILDLGLPNGGGFVVIERLKAAPPLDAIPIIVVSASDARANQERASKAGAAAYLQKPVDNAEFLTVIRKALGESSPNHPPAAARTVAYGTNDPNEEPSLQMELDVIREKLLRRLESELPLLTALLDRIQGGDSTALVQLQTLVHRIRGSAALFNFAVISGSAGQVEDLLNAFIAASAKSVAEPLSMPRLLECGQRLGLDIGAATSAP